VATLFYYDAATFDYSITNIVTRVCRFVDVGRQVQSAGLNHTNGKV